MQMPRSHWAKPMYSLILSKDIGLPGAQVLHWPHVEGWISVQKLCQPDQRVRFRISNLEGGKGQLKNNRHAFNDLISDFTMSVAYGISAWGPNGLKLMSIFARVVNMLVHSCQGVQTA